MTYEKWQIAVRCPDFYLSLVIGHLSEVESVNIASVEDEGGAESHFVLQHFNPAESPGGHLAAAAFQFSCAQGAGHVDRQIAQIDRVPQHDALDHPLIDVGLAHIGQ